MDKLQISTEHLRVGLYVSELDRPWLETPFLFQGFKVRDEDDIAELRKHCRTVIVDFEQSQLSGEERRKLVSVVQREQEGRRVETAAPPAVVKKKAVDVPEPDLRRTGRYYVDSAKLGEELRRAGDLRNEASAAVTDVMDSVRKGGKLDMPQLEQVVDPLVDSVLRNRDAMAWLVRIRETDEYVYQHSIGSSVWSVVFGRHLGLDKETLVSVGLGGMLLDIGKTRIPVDILRKSGPLTPKEHALMKRHVEFGLEVLAEAGNIDPRVECMIATHHERFDGSGYPNQLTETSIPVLGRIAGIVDSYDAMVSRRPYAETLSSFDAMRKLQSLAKTKFQGEMVDQFVQAVGMFPTGSLVELNTGEVGVVTAQNNYQRLRPEVMIILDRDKQFLPEFKTIDLRMMTADDSGRESMWIDRGLEPGAYGVDPAEYFL